MIEAVELLPGDPRLPTKTADGQPWPAQAGALLVRGQLNLQTADGKAAAADIDFYGPDSAFSIGYKPVRAKQRNGLRELHDVDLFEVSVGILHGAHPHARVVDDPGPLETKSALPLRMRPRTRRRRGTVPIGRADWERYRWAKLKSIKDDVDARAGRLDPDDLARHRRSRRYVQRAEEDEADAAAAGADVVTESYAETVERDHLYAMTDDAQLVRVLPCAGCGVRLGFDMRGPLPPRISVRCAGCR